MITAEQVMEEVRESRRRMSAECDHDPARYISMRSTPPRRVSGRRRPAQKWKPSRSHRPLSRLFQDLRVFWARLPKARRWT